MSSLPNDAHFIGIDVGTGSARACIINARGDIVSLASENISLWQPQPGFYEQSTTEIWSKISIAVRRALSTSKDTTTGNPIDPNSIKGIGFDATCSLAVFNNETREPISVTGPNFASDQNIILWLDHRPVEETALINSTNHNLLRYVGGSMSVEMELPKVLWLKNHMPADLFAKSSFYDLADALTHIATGNNKRSFCSAVCKQGYVPVGVDGSVKGWQEEFLQEIGLEDLVKDDFIRMGGVDGVNGNYLSAGELVGYLCETAAKDLGLPPGIAIGSGVIDAYAGWIGTVGAKVDLTTQQLNAETSPNDKSQAFSRLAAVAGTSTCHLAMSPTPLFVPGVWGPYRDTIIPNYWMTEGGQSATGELLKHIIETHPAYKEASSLASAASQNIYTFLNKHLSTMAQRTSAPSISWLGRHFFLYGDLWGNRSPIADASMTGSIIGMNSKNYTSGSGSVDGLAIFYYGTMEFIALQTRQIISTMNESGHKISSIFMSGSQCQNDILMKIIASVCGVPVVIPEYIHSAVCHGAAMLGAKAASAVIGTAGGGDGSEGTTEGQGEDLWDIMDRMSKPGRKIDPSTDEKEIALFGVKYEVFLEQCFNQRRYRGLIDDVVEGWK